METETLLRLAKMDLFQELSLTFLRCIEGGQIKEMKMGRK